MYYDVSELFELVKKMLYFGWRTGARITLFITLYLFLGLITKNREQGDN
jgi:hypothetical protein